MKLFRVYNGFMGFSAISIAVLAETEERAITLAKEEFKKNKGRHGKSYYEDLNAEELFEDTSKEDLIWIEV